MSAIAIKVENLSKRYRIGQAEERHDTLVGTMTSFLRQPVKNLRRLRRLTTFSNNGQGDESDVIWALKDISFEVQRGEVVGIIGRNGAGKSTLLKILSRITHPTNGRVELDGRVSSLLEVGTGFHPELTGRENIYLNGTILGMTKTDVDRKFAEIVDFSGVNRFIDTPVKFYSSGMRVRLAFSVAAYLEPEILLIDEVLAVGDAGFQKKCLGKMEKEAKAGRTVLFVSHNMSAIHALCERCVLLECGKIKYTGTTEDTIKKYLTGMNNTSSRSSHIMAHPGRREGSIPVIREFRLLIEDKQVETTSMMVGDPVEFEFLLDPGMRVFENAVLSIGIYDVWGRIVLQGKTNRQYPDYWKLDQPKKIWMLWKRCLLTPGIYKIGVSFSSGNDVIDWIDDVLDVDVKVDKDFFGTGKSALQTKGILFPMVEWKIDK